MHAYWLTGMTGLDSAGHYHATLGDAHAAAKGHVKIHPQDKPEIRIELVSILTDKAAILRMLNGEGQFQDGGPIRTWALGERGGLREVQNGE